MDCYPHLLAIQQVYTLIVFLCATFFAVVVHGRWRFVLLALLFPLCCFLIYLGHLISGAASCMSPPKRLVLLDGKLCVVALPSPAPPAPHYPDARN